MTEITIGADISKDHIDLHRLPDGKLAGLAPSDRQSGRWTGRASITGGRAIVRQALYLPALVAIRFSPDLKEYDALRKMGKPLKVAMTVIIRKLVVLANALLRKQKKWTPKQA